MELTERVLEKAAYFAQVMHAAMTLLAIVLLYALLIVIVVALFIFVSIMATLIILMPVAIVALVVIIVTEFFSYFWTIAPGGDGLVINLYAGIIVQGNDGVGGRVQGPEGTSNGRGDADNGRGWLRWGLRWWWWVAIVAVAAYFLVTDPV